MEVEKLNTKILLILRKDTSFASACDQLKTWKVLGLYPDTIDMEIRCLISICG